PLAMNQLRRWGHVLQIHLPYGSIHKKGMEIKPAFKIVSGMVNPEKDVEDSAERQIHKSGVQLHAEHRSLPPQCRKQRAPASHEWVEDQVAFVRRGEDYAFEQSHRFLRRMFAEVFLVTFGGSNLPNAFHLLAACHLAHQFVIERV